MRNAEVSLRLQSSIPAGDIYGPPYAIPSVVCGLCETIDYDNSQFSGCRARGETCREIAQTIWEGFDNMTLFIHQRKPDIAIPASCDALCSM